MSHRYTLLVSGTILPGGGAPDVTALAWAADTILAVGSDAAIAGISRGDSHVVDLGGAFVVPLDPSGDPRWPSVAILEVGGPADLAVLDHDPRALDARAPGTLATLAVVRGGRVVAGRLPGTAHPGHDPDHDGGE